MLGPQETRETDIVLEEGPPTLSELPSLFCSPQQWSTLQGWLQTVLTPLPGPSPSYWLPEYKGSYIMGRSFPTEFYDILENRSVGPTCGNHFTMYMYIETP